ncbi:MAG: hypothetical protein E6H88_03585 [Chloroflexi bacterium]|nr:MAG: hypothetical protein E6H88_03585 [Chloroflexota bacterium]
MREKGDIGPEAQGEGEGERGEAAAQAQPAEGEDTERHDGAEDRGHHDGLLVEPVALGDGAHRERAHRDDPRRDHDRCRGEAKLRQA